MSGEGLWGIEIEMERVDGWVMDDGCGDVWMYGRFMEGWEGWRDGDDMRGGFWMLVVSFEGAV